MVVRELGSRLVASTSSHKQETSLVTKQRATVTNQVVLVVKNPSADAGGVRDGGQRCRLEMSGRPPWRGEWQPSLFLPGEFPGQRRLIGYSS